jgi:hypothetical protein
MISALGAFFVNQDIIGAQMNDVKSVAQAFTVRLNPFGSRRRGTLGGPEI